MKKLDKVFNISKIVLLLFFFQSLLVSSFSADEYFIKLIDLPCKDLTLKFKVLNKTEYDLDPNKGLDEYRSLNGTEYTIYDGPFESFPILATGTTNESGYFTYKFNKTQQYLIQLMGVKDGNTTIFYNLDDYVVDIEDCNFDAEELEKTYSKNFFINYYLVRIENASYDLQFVPLEFKEYEEKFKSAFDLINSTYNITKIEKDYNYRNKSDNENQSFNLSSYINETDFNLYVKINIRKANKKFTYDKLYVGFSVNNSIYIDQKVVFNDTDLTLKSYNLNNKSYELFEYLGEGNYYIYLKLNKSFVIDYINHLLCPECYQKNDSYENNSVNNNITINKSNESDNITGILEENSVSTNGVENETDKKINDNENAETNISTNSLESESNPKTANNQKSLNDDLLLSRSKKKKNTKLIVLLISLLLITLGLFFVYKKGFIKMPNKKTSNVNKPINVQSTHSAANQNLFNLTREYVRRYKESYSKDQIYVALKRSNVPDEIIIQVFSEEY